ncbi:MAG: 3-phosphoshikimate 1-carboxyvinyltransferase [Euryarchaeota archaeon]|nr:3-phosphoshikimate 1-carboxyvinyltransferase [Euryarchaeota archaeon]
MATLVVRPTPGLRGVVRLPGSKSYTHRALLGGLLAGESTLRGPLVCDDTRRSLDAIRALGARARARGDRLHIRGTGGRLRTPRAPLRFGESGTSLRLFLPAASLCRGEVVLDGEGSLRRRPNGYLVECLRRLGVRVHGRGADHRVPLRVQGRGVFPGGHLRLAGDIYSSQFLSALLVAAPLGDSETVLEIPGDMVSRPYVDITLDVLRRHGVRVARRGYRRFTIPPRQHYGDPGDLSIPGDLSSASFLLAAASLVDSRVVLRGARRDPQGDWAMADHLRRMGARVSHSGDALEVRGPFSLRGIEVNARDTPDLVPVLAMLGLFTEGPMEIGGAAHLRLKESDRISAPAQEFARLGAHATSRRDGLRVEKGPRPGSVVRVDSHGDHRIAMALAVAGLRLGPLAIRGAECIAKSYPGFVGDMRRLGARMAWVGYRPTGNLPK